MNLLQRSETPDVGSETQRVLKMVEQSCKSRQIHAQRLAASKLLIEMTRTLTTLSTQTFSTSRVSRFSTLLMKVLNLNPQGG